MKTSIKTLFATALTVIALTSSAFSSFAHDGEKNQKVAATAMNINMVTIKGDVDVYLVKSDKEDIKIISSSVEDPAVRIEKKGPKLFITGAENERVTMYVYVKDLRRIEAWNTSNVKTQGAFDLNALQVLLHDNAKANLNVNTKSLYTVIKDEASLKLSGKTDTHDVSRSEYATLKMHKFNAGRTQGLTIAPVYATAIAKRN